MIGGADMYMPLCRDCHARETRLNQRNHFEGDPEIVNQSNLPSTSASVPSVFPHSDVEGDHLFQL